MSLDSLSLHSPENVQKISLNCAFCQKEHLNYLCLNIPYIQEHLLNAANILSLIVETTPTKELCFASETVNRDDIAITALALISLMQKLDVLKEDQNKEEELFD